MIVPAYLPYYVLAGAIGTIAAVLFGLRGALRNAGWTTYDRTVTALAATIWRRWQSSAGAPCATTTVAKSHAFRRESGLLAPQGFDS